MSDTLQRFLFEGQPVRGELVHLDATWRAVLARRDYPEPVRRVLGEAMAAAALLSASIKFDGTLTLQIQARGPLRLLVVQVTSVRTLRGLARWEGEPRDGALHALCGEGVLAITIDAGQGSEPWQGVVSLAGATLAEALEGYFRDSEQLPTHIMLAADDARCAGLMVQRMPGDAPDADIWNRVDHLVATLGEVELLDLEPLTLLGRLFHEEDVRLFEAEPVHFRCTCSRDRTRAMLQAMTIEELHEALAETGVVHVDCEFCGQRYSFDPVDVEALLAGAGDASPSDLRH